MFPENIALSRPVSMSTYTEGSAGYIAVDGLIPYSSGNEYFAISKLERGPYLTVDLGRNEPVEFIRFYKPKAGMICLHYQHRLIVVSHC